MITANQMEQLKLEAADLSRFSNHMSVVLSVILSLTAVAIISKQQLTNYLWVNVAAFAIPLPIALYFRMSIGRLGAFVFPAVLILALAAAVMFGM